MDDSSEGTYLRGGEGMTSTATMTSPEEAGMHERDLKQKKQVWEFALAVGHLTLSELQKRSHTNFKAFSPKTRPRKR